MKPWVKKLVVYSTIATLQLGLGAAVSEASPRHDNNNNRYENHQQQDRFESRDRHEKERRVQEEKERHEREMQRRHDEREHEWRERQRSENDRHQQALNTILGVALVCAILDN